MRRTRLLSLIAAVALMAMACGDDAETEPATTSVPASTPTSAPTTTAPPSGTSVVSTTTSTTKAPSTPSPGPTLSEVIASIEVTEDLPFRDQPDSRIVCDEPDSMIVERGTVLYCDSEMPPGYEAGTWLIVITDDSGTAAYNTATDMADLHDWQGPGLLCRDLLALPYLHAVEDAELNPVQDAVSYLFVLAYWFQDGQPDRMDADLDGIPCETLFDPAVVEQVWAGGLF